MEGPYTEEEDEDSQSSSSGTLTCSVPEVKPPKPPVYLPVLMHPFATESEYFSVFLFTLNLSAMAAHLHLLMFYLYTFMNGNYT